MTSLPACASITAMRITWLSVTLACVLAGTGCGKSSNSSGSSSPTAPGTGGGTSSRCRTYPTVASVTTTAAGITQNANLTGAFNASTNQATITISFVGGGLCSTAVHSYRSVADFVDEVRVIPPVPLVLSTTTTNSGSCGSGVGTSTNTYDAQRRLTQTSTVGGTITYTAWDTSNRPTTGTMSTGGTISNVYNDPARTITQTQVSGGVTTVTTMSFDANGAQTMIVVTVGGAVVTTTTFNNTATAQVCS
jgi:YD repeat-containing protein